MDTVVRPLIGWPLFALPDEDGRLDYPTLEDSVRQLIRVVLSTRPGEQLMRPDFGGGLDTQLHQPNTPATRSRIRDLVRDAVARWERRILLDRVEVQEVAGEPGHVGIDLESAGCGVDQHLAAVRDPVRPEGARLDAGPARIAADAAAVLPGDDEASFNLE